MSYRQFTLITVCGLLTWPFIVAGFVGCAIGHAWNTGIELYQELWLNT